MNEYCPFGAIILIFAIMTFIVIFCLINIMFKFYKHFARKVSRGRAVSRSSPFTKRGFEPRHPSYQDRSKFSKIKLYQKSKSWKSYHSTDFSTPKFETDAEQTKINSDISNFTRNSSTDIAPVQDEHFNQVV